ncbi:hypothetical protein DERP_011301 [Dermatophagoides pteronyssinus]|uniref:Uncharacterized protein n=1 Tax=Dermatophagoides pteronyssinus TaxID=6956 RepID=A0ABQ8J768_DERPT|nr:hypothetical protein DERP_011301 [Dermatophagoides pteronyssinus]
MVTIFEMDCRRSKTITIKLIYKSMQSAICYLATKADRQGHQGISSHNTIIYIKLTPAVWHFE